MDDLPEDQETKNLGGRPTKYCDKLRISICDRLAEGETLRSICRDNDMPDRSTIARWSYENIGEVKDGEEVKVQGFYYHYTRARDVGLDVMADDILDISDTYIKAKKTKTYKVDGKDVTEVMTGDAVERARLRVESRKWYLSKMAPKRYGNERVIKHQQLDKEGETTDPATPQINVYAQDISDSVHAEMKKAGNDTENPA